MSSYHMMLVLVKAIHEATQKGEIRWEADLGDPDRYSAQVGSGSFAVEFLRYALAGQRVMKRNAVRLSAFGASMEFFNGTEGMELISEMVLERDTAWVAWRRQMECERHTQLELPGDVGIP